MRTHSCKYNSMDNPNMLAKRTCRGTSCAVAEVGTFIRVPGFGTTVPLLTMPLVPVGE